MMSWDEEIWEEEGEGEPIWLEDNDDSEEEEEEREENTSDRSLPDGSNNEYGNLGRCPPSELY